MAKIQNVPILLVGETGDGKTSTFGEILDEGGKVISVGLKPEKTLFINTENKPLPFSNQGQFANKIITNYKTLNDLLDLLIKSGEGTLVDTKEAKLSQLNYKYDNVVLDSFTSMTEHIHKYVNFQYAGYEVWNQYNMLIMDLINKLKKLKQQVFVLAIPEQKEMAFNQVKSFARVKGKELKYGNIEKEFTIVLFTNPVYNDESGEVEKVELIYKPNRLNTAKSPIGIFKRRPPNDASVIVQALKDFYGRETKKTS